MFASVTSEEIIQINFLCILFLTLKCNMHMIHMDATLAELRLLGKNTRHYQVGYILIASLAFILIASLESLNYKPTKVLAQQR